MNTQSNIAVLYLARCAEGLQPIREFVHSYRKYDSGIGHELIVVFKGYKKEDQLALARAEFAGLTFSSIELLDEGFDLGSYFQAANKISHEYIVFLNTFSHILCDGWLQKLYAHASDSDVGLVGATGSYQSVHSWMKLLQKTYYVLRCQYLNKKTREEILKYFHFLISDQKLSYYDFFEKCVCFIKKDKLIKRVTFFLIRRSLNIAFYLIRLNVNLFIDFPFYLAKRVKRFARKEEFAKRLSVFILKGFWKKLFFISIHLWQLICKITKHFLLLFVFFWKSLYILCSYFFFNKYSFEMKYQKWWQRMTSVGDLANFCKFPEFPNHHIRTNAFMIKRDRFLRLRRPIFREKIDACFFESGKDSMTHQILAAGLKTKVVGSNGEGYDLENWFSSNTFRSGQQKNLLVSDNQTRNFDLVSAEERLVLELTTWGEELITLPQDFPRLNLRFSYKKR